MPAPWWLGILSQGAMTMIDLEFSDNRTLLTIDELAGVNGGLQTGGECPVSPTPQPSGASASAQGATMGGSWNWGGSRTNVRVTC
jgi:hypothetical protein